ANVLQATFPFDNGSIQTEPLPSVGNEERDIHIAELLTRTFSGMKCGPTIEDFAILQCIRYFPFENEHRWQGATAREESKKIRRTVANANQLWIRSSPSRECHLGAAGLFGGQTEGGRIARVPQHSGLWRCRLPARQTKQIGS